ncbi:MAG: hypothetical protein OXH32_05410 [Acidobacteria bacterium]|nr:hypothetical protein [Acidobacteriota bacterium]
MKKVREASEVWAGARDAIPLRKLSVAGVVVCLLAAAVWGLGVEQAQKAIRSAPAVVSTLWGWPRALLEERRLREVEVLRAEAAEKRFVAENTEFLFPLPEEIRDSLRRRFLDSSVMLELKAKRLRSGTMVDTYVPVDMWMDHFVVYPLEVEIPEDWSPPPDGREAGEAAESP